MKSLNKNLINKIAVAVTFLVMVVFFNNCKGKSEGALELQSLSPVLDSSSGGSTAPGAATGTLCEQDLKNLYARGWQTFLKTNCAICHSNGPGKGRFANSDLDIAFGDFMQVGYTKVSANAVNPTHNPPYTGVQHTQAANELKVEWLTGLQENAKCSGSNADMPTETQVQKITLKTSELATGLTKDGDKVVLSWTINSDLIRTKGAEALPNIPGGKISITVARLKNASGATYYDFSLPTIYGASVDTRIQGLFINMNGFLLGYPTTFSYVDKSVRQGSKNDITGLVSIGTLVAPKAVLPTDTVSLSFINISQVVMPPPPAVVTVNISNSKNVVVPKGTDFIDVTLSLSEAASEPVVVTLSEDTDLCGKAVTYTNSNTYFQTVGASCLKDVYDVVCPGGSCAAAAKDFGRARSIVGTTWNRFDWDYKFPLSSVIFKMGESSKTLRVFFSKDIRNEKNRVLSFGIASVLGTVQIGANKSINFIINKFSNPIPSGNVLTLSELMNEKAGILGQNCVKCHNSAKLAGGYDMTDYEWMLQKRVVIPGDVNSKMYARMHDSGNTLVKPMPFDGFLPQALVLEVERWLLDGALNN
ncbi:MAG: hypothetical protein WA160_13990 [Pseudobdellovibrio sp.]